MLLRKLVSTYKFTRHQNTVDQHGYERNIVCGQNYWKFILNCLPMEYWYLVFEEHLLCGNLIVLRFLRTLVLVRPER